MDKYPFHHPQEDWELILNPMHGQTAIVTGASGGIGVEAVRLLIKNGYSVIGLDKDYHPDLGTLPGDQYCHVKVDITDDDSVRQACVQIRQIGSAEPKAFATPSHAILAAGGALPEEVCYEDPLDLHLDTFQKSVTVNLSGQYVCLKHFVPLLERAEKPTLGSAAIVDRSITMVSSINSVGDFGYPAYASAKAGLAGLARSLAGSLGRRGIRINVVAFGTVRTQYAEELHASDPSHFSRLEKLAALERISTSTEAAQVLLAMTQLSSVTGQVITADCGQAIPGNRRYSPATPELYVQDPAVISDKEVESAPWSF